jgi:Nucleotidyltransferase domain
MNLSRPHTAVIAGALQQDDLSVQAGRRDPTGRRSLASPLMGLIAEWRVPAVHASMFGSAARGEGDTRSDIDLLVVRPDSVDSEDPTWRDKLYELAVAIERWTGNHAGISEVGEEEFSHLASRRAPFVEELERDAMTASGPDEAMSDRRRGQNPEQRCDGARGCRRLGRCVERVP